MKHRMFFLGVVRVHTLYSNRIGRPKGSMAGKQIAS